MSFNLRKTLFSLSSATVLCVALQSGVMSGQVFSSSGSDNYSRFLLRATNNSVALWLLDGNQDNPGLNQYYGPYLGWEPVAISTGADNWTRILWKHTDGSITIWLLDPLMVWRSQRVFTAASLTPGWVPITLSVKPNGQTSVLWKRTDGILAVWLLNGNLDPIQNKQYGPFPAFDPGSTAVKAPNDSEQGSKASGDMSNPTANSH